MIKIISSENIENNNYLVKGIFNNKPFKAFAYQDNNVFKVTINGFTYTKKININEDIESVNDKESKYRIKSPVTGVIKEVMIKEGDIVSIGQELIRIESMKLIITINSEVNGVIKKLNIPDNFRVKSDELIIFISEML